MIDQGDAVARSRAQIPAELLLALVTLVAVVGFIRLFAPAGAVTELLLAAVAAHLLNAGARRAGLGALATVALAAGVATLQISVVLYPHVSLAGLPTGTTATTAMDDLRQAWDLFGQVQAPVPAERGFLLASTVAIWMAASLADWAGMRLRATAEAVLPAGALFVFTILLGREDHRLVLTSALALAILSFALAQRIGRSAVDDTWVGGRVALGVADMARRGGIVVLVAVCLAAVVAPRVPVVGGGGEALVAWRDQPDQGRVTVSPLVDIRARLVQLPDSVVFRVRAEQPAYWRLTSLDRFNGQVWSSNESFSSADGNLPHTPPEATTRELVQSYSIVALGSIWAPAALTPVEVHESSTDLRWNSEMATLIVPRSVDSVDEIQYQVTSQVPEFLPTDLDATLPDPLPDELAQAVELPVLPPEVARLAREVTAGSGPTPYAQARALQDWFRTEFTYDLTGVVAGHSSNAISDFLESRRGYCEQFAGTFAAMARSLGLPARVAVGFTPGEVDATGQQYTVRGRNAHSWPEVYIPGAGWVPFEPTPGRGQPGTEVYTGVSPAQDDLEPPIPTTQPVTPPTVAPAPDTGPAPSEGLDDGPDDALRAADPGVGSGSGPDGTRALAMAALALGAGLATVALYALALAVLRTVRRRRRRRITQVPARIRAAWGEASTAAGRLGHPRAPAETDVEYASRAAPALGPAGPALTRLAALATGTTWAPPDRPVDPVLAAEADGLAHRVDVEVRSRLTGPQRLWRWLDPRSELRGH